MEVQNCCVVIHGTDITSATFGCFVYFTIVLKAFRSPKILFQVETADELQ